VTDGAFAQWAIKTSFLNYLSLLPGSSQSVTAGAELLDIGAYRFPLVDRDGYDTASGLGELRFGGDVRFGAHDGAMFVMVADPWVKFRALESGPSASLSIRTMIDSEVPARVQLAGDGTVDVRENGALLRVGDLVLTEPGRELFGGVYPPGTGVDAIFIRLAFLGIPGR
jgi:hypothetical protein